MIARPSGGSFPMPNSGRSKPSMGTSHCSAPMPTRSARSTTTSVNCSRQKFDVYGARGLRRGKGNERGGGADCPARVTEAQRAVMLNSDGLLSGSLDRGAHLGRLERHRAQTDADGVEDGVRDRGRNHRGRRLARAPGLLGRPVDELDHDLRYLGEGDDRIGRPVEARDMRAVEGDLFLEGAAPGPDDVAFALVLDAVGVDELPAIMRDEEAQDADGAA